MVGKKRESLFWPFSLIVDNTKKGPANCSGQFLSCTRIKTRVRRQTIGYATNIIQLFLRTLLLPRNKRPWGHFSFRGINGLEDTHPPEESTAPRMLLFPRVSPLQNQSRARRLQHTTSLISTYIHEVSLLFLRASPLQDQSRADGCNNRPHWNPPTFMEYVMPPDHLAFQTLQQLLLQHRSL